MTTLLAAPKSPYDGRNTEEENGPSNSDNHTNDRIPRGRAEAWALRAPSTGVETGGCGRRYCRGGGVGLFHYAAADGLYSRDHHWGQARCDGVGDRALNDPTGRIGAGGAG